MDIVTLGAALNGSAEYVNSHFKGGSNIQIVDNPDGTQTINASGEVSAEDTIARAEIAAIKDGETLDSFGDVETALDTKANTSTTYTKTEVDTALSAKANSADVYSKTAVDTALGNKADKSTTYTKTEVDTALNAKADKSTTYTKTEVDTALDDKVDKETGKGLSTNDYTTVEKTKLDNLAEIKTVGTGLNLDDNGELTATGGGSGGTTNYNDLSNKPQINGNTLSGNKTSVQLGLASTSDIPTALADLSDDSTHRTVSDTEKSTWNGKQNAISDLETIRSGAAAGATAVQPVSGKGLSTNDYTNDEKTKLTGIAEGAEVNVQSDWAQTTTTADDYIKNKPTLGTAAATDATAYATAAQGTKADSAIQTVKVNDTALTPTSAKAVNITVPTQASDINALPNTTKYAAALSLTINSSTFVMTGQLKDQNGDNLGTAQTIDLPLESVVVGGSYDSQTKKVILTLQNGNTIEFSVADLVSGLQTELSATNKLDPSFINYDTTHAAVTESDKTTWSGKQDALTFDGTYSASTNKAATVSTVTNAVNALDVTGDASVSASKTISAWSETDGKVSISTQDIAITGTQATLTGYAKSGTAGQAVAATDNVNQAIGKLEATVDDNKNNILSLTQYGGGINKFQVTATTTTVNGITFTVNADKTITATGSIADSSQNAIFTMGAYTAVSGDVLSEGFVEANSKAYIYARGGSTSLTTAPYRAILAGDIGVQRTYACVITGTTVGQVNITFKPMICNSDSYAKSGVYQPYAMSNAELAAKEQTNETNISKALTLEQGISIQRGADLNTYTTIGVYYAEDINVARSLTNSPVNTSTGSPFRLEVMENNKGSRFIQKIYEPAIDNSTINVYIRAYTLSGWSSWFKVGLTAV